MGFPSALEMFYICPKVGKEYIIIVNLLIEQGFKVEFETIKCWLVIVEVLQKKVVILVNWNHLILGCRLYHQTKETICDIKDLDISLCKAYQSLS